MEFNSLSFNLPSLLKAINPLAIIVSPDTLLSEVIGMMGMSSESQDVNCCSEIAEETIFSHKNQDLEEEKRFNSNCVLVMESSRIVGIFTLQDLVRVVAFGEVGKNQLTIAEVMTNPVVTLQLSEVQDIFAPLLFFRQHQIRHLPIVNNQNQLLGIVTPASILQVLQPTNLLRLGTVREVMNDELMSARHTASVFDVARLMALYRVRCVVITQSKETTEKQEELSSFVSIPIGVITERNILEALVLGRELVTTPASSVMRRLGCELNPTNSLLYAYQQMQNDRMDTLLVSERQENNLGVRLGIITKMDILRSLEPAQIYQRLKKAQQSVQQLQAEKTALLQSRNAELEQLVQQQTSELREALTKVKQQAKQAALINQITQAMRGSLVLDKILQTTANQLHEALQVSRCLIFRPEGLDCLAVNYVSEATADGASFIGFQCDFYCYYNAQLSGGIPVVLSRIDSSLSPEIQAFAREYGIRSIALVPLFYQQSYIGGISLHECDREREWTTDEIEFVKAIGDNCAIAIHQAELYEQVQNQLKERQKAEAALRISEQQFQQLAQSLRQSFFIRDVKLDRTIYISSAFEEMWGISPEVIYERPKAFLDYIHPEDRDRILAATEDRKCKNPFHHEYRIIRPDGEMRWMLTRAFPLENEQGKIYRAIGIIEDITDRKQAEISLQTKEELFRSLSECSPVGIFVADVQGRCIYTNPRCQAICGFTFEESLGAGWAQFIHPEDFEKVFLSWSAVARECQESFQEYRFLHKDGTIRWVNVRTAPLFLEVQNLLGYVGTIEDITQSKLAEEQIKSSLQEKEVLLKEVHHRVKNNLQIVYSLLDLQSQQVDNPHTIAMFQASQNRIRSMALIHEKLYRSDNMARVDFSEYITTLTNHLLHAYALFPGQINLVLDLDNVFLNIDMAIPCGLIINELVSNALKHAFPDQHQGKITVELKSLNEQILLRIQDNSTKKYDFKLTEKQQGLGIKLVKILVHQIEGTLEIAQDRGTIFTIKFKELKF